MYPEDRVLIAYVARPKDFDIIRAEAWYRVPLRYAPKGLHAEYFAFYFGRHFGELKWAIHYYARQEGNELQARRVLLPDEPDHPHADELYYRVSLGELVRLERPIVSLRWRRIAFIHTTWDRFQDAREINDLFVEGGEYVDRLYAILKERGLRPERNYELKDDGEPYVVPLAVPCRAGEVTVTAAELPQSDDEVVNIAAEIERRVAARGRIAIM
jgi:hypothetical protein